MTLKIALAQINLPVGDIEKNAESVIRVARLVDINEYKRRQAPPGVRITGGPSDGIGAIP